LTSEYERLDAAMDRRRLDQGMSWRELSNAAHIADVTLRNIRRGRNRPTALNKRRIEDALGWEHGSIDAILAGGEPRPLGAQLSDRAHADDTLTVMKQDPELQQLFDEAQDDPVLRAALLSVARLREVRRRPPDNDNDARRRQSG
jgi:transcriptional regulator with XRE-family HTH domain